MLSRSQGLFLATGSLQASTPYLGGVLLAVITTWLFAADSLSKKVWTLTALGLYAFLSVSFAVPFTAFAHQRAP